MKTAVNAEGEGQSSFATIPRPDLEQMAADAADTIARLQGEATSLVNAFVALILRDGSKLDAGAEIQLTQADLDRIAAHYFTMNRDAATGTVTLRAQRRGNASTLALSVAQQQDNAKAAEIALPKSGIIAPPSKLILP